MFLPNGRVRKRRETRQVPGEAHELTFSCYRRLPLLAKDRTRQWFIDALDTARRKLDLELWAYVVMPEHVHLLLLPKRPDYRIATILKTIKQPVAERAFTHLRRHAPHWLARLRIFRRDGQVSHRFWQQGGGYDRNIHNPETAWSCVEYIHANPVRRGLVSDSLAWPWSSAGW